MSDASGVVVDCGRGWSDGEGREGCGVVGLELGCLKGCYQDGVDSWVLELQVATRNDEREPRLRTLTIQTVAHELVFLENEQKQPDATRRACWNSCDKFGGRCWS